MTPQRESVGKHNRPSKKKGAYASSEDDTTGIVSEPLSTYGYRSVDPSQARIMGLMGMDGKRAFADVKNDSDLISIIRSGIPKQAMTHLMEIADLTLAEMAAIVHTSDRTLRRYTAQQKLSQEQSERMIEMARLYSRGEEVFGSMEEFKEWMNMVLLPFGNKKPKDFLDTSIGIGMIIDELGRIQHGVFA